MWEFIFYVCVVVEALLLGVVILLILDGSKQK